MIIKNLKVKFIVLVLISSSFIVSIMPSCGADSEDFDIQEAIDEAENGDVIIVPDGIYAGGIDFLGKSIYVVSENGSDNCIIDGGGTTFGVKFDNYEGINTILAGFTITNCRASNSNGGGIYFGMYVTPTIMDCVIRRNIAEGIYPSQTALGGGIFCDRYSSPTLLRCKITNNIALGDSNHYAYGGGVSGCYASPILKNCLIAENLATTVGGGHACGGGLSFLYGDSFPVLESCMIVDNDADTSGGGIALRYGPHVKIQSCTFSNNRVILSSCTSGGAVSCMEGGNAYIRSSILWNDHPNEIFINGLYSFPDTVRVDIDYSDIQGGKDDIDIINNVYHGEDHMGILTNLLHYGQYNFNLNPRFVNPDNGDFHITRRSPCLDAGEKEFRQFIREKDYDCQPRVYDIPWETYFSRSPLDVGADEYQPILQLSKSIYDPDDDVP